jgi:hypothetical protein
MSQHVTPGDLAGTISATKGRVSRLERELVAVKRNRTRTVSDWDNRIAIHGSALAAENVAMAWLPHDAQIVSLSIFSQVIGTPGRLSAGLLLRPSAESAEEYFVTRPGDELRLLGGSSFVDVTWTPDNSLTPVRVDVVPRVVPQLVPVFVVLSQPGAVTGDYTFLQAVFEFDIGPRQPSA